MTKLVVLNAVLTDLVTTQTAPVANESERKLLKFSVFNPTAATVTLEIYTPQNGQVSGATNQQLKKDVYPGETDICEELIGLYLPAGANLYAKGKDLNFSYVADESDIA